MTIRFVYEYIDTDKFETLYEEELREEKEIRDAVIRNGLVVYMYLDDVLIGESFGISPNEYMVRLDEGQGSYYKEDAIVDVNMDDKESIYVWSTTILPHFRGMGYGKKLREEFTRYASKMGYAKLVGHSTSPTMTGIMKDLGAIFRKSAVHKKWFGTRRTAHFYTQFLTQTKEFNCGPFALAYLLETKEMTYNTHDLEISLKTTNEYGTSPDNIGKFLKTKKIPFKLVKELEPNSMIDINIGGDGHWITIVRQNPSTGNWWSYDPDQGYVQFQATYLAENWYSPRYGKHQGFTLI
jgi:GNAT superfamily N-acetyltransferase